LLDFEVSKPGGRFELNLADLSLRELEDPKAVKKAAGNSVAKKEPQPARSRQATRRGPGRAEQHKQVTSPDGKWIARYRDYNVVLEKVVADVEPDRKKQPAAADNTPQDTPQDATDDQPDSNRTKHVQVTASGTESFRYGTACWVYGEELHQSSAMWWSPDSSKLAFYEIDERHLRDYFLTTDNTKLYTQLQVVHYPKAGEDNPFAGLLVYDLSSRQTTRIDVGGDRLQYVYNIRFTPDGSELLFSRTNRRQDTLEVMAADLQTGQSRLVVKEVQSTWQANKPLMQFLKDGKRFVWETERTGWKHYELRHLDGRRLNALSEADGYPAESIVLVNEDKGCLFYTAYSGNNPNHAQLHRVQLDGTQQVRLTSDPLNHTGIQISPDGTWFIASSESVGVPPTTELFNMHGDQVAILAKPNLEQAEKLELADAELFTFKADDGNTDIYGTLYKPSNFDPSKKYPLVISVYGGPGSRGIRSRYVAANAYCEFGFLVATIANRGTTGRGKAFESATYLKLGVVDIKDQADGVRFLSQRPYVDKERVGIFGHSYGGYMSTLAVVRYPDLFHVASAGAPVTDWKNYDTIYTERYMRTPQENPDGYRDGSCLTHAKELKGHLLLMHGLIDDNVHPSNSWQLADLLQREDIRFDMVVYPLSKHGLGRNSNQIRWEHLHRFLRPEPESATAAVAVDKVPGSMSVSQ
jgi:dipeptidyl-peptidase-4